MGLLKRKVLFGQMLAALRDAENDLTFTNGFACRIADSVNSGKYSKIQKELWYNLLIALIV